MSIPDFTSFIRATTFRLASCNKEEAKRRKAHANHFAAYAAAGLNESPLAFRRFTAALTQAN